MGLIAAGSFFGRWRKQQHSHLYTVVENASADGLQEEKLTPDFHGTLRRNRWMNWTLMAVLWLISASILGVIMPFSLKIFQKPGAPQWFPDGKSRCMVLGTILIDVKFQRGLTNSMKTRRSLRPRTP
jgi:hypothetical protein